LVAHDGRLWVFTADEAKQGRRRIMELVPDGPPRTGDVAQADPTPLDAWLTSTLSHVLEENQVRNPQWQLFSPRQVYFADKFLLENKSFLDGECTVTLVGRESQVYWVRQVALPPDRNVALHLRTASLDGGAWKLVVRVDQETVFERRYDAAKSPPAWIDERIDLAKFRGKTIRLVVASDADDKKSTYVGWQTMEVR
jgi:hypothetical protein